MVRLEPDRMNIDESSGILLIEAPLHIHTG
jgi:hypothetical protein